MVEDRWHLAIEIAIEQIDQQPRRDAVGPGGEPAHVRSPDRGVDLFDAPRGEDTLPGVRPDIRVEQNTSGSPHGPDFGNPGQRGDDGLNPSDLQIGKTAGLPRRPGRQANGAVGEEERRRR